SHSPLDGVARRDTPVFGPRCHHFEAWSGVYQALTLVPWRIPSIPELARERRSRRKPSRCSCASGSSGNALNGRASLIELLEEVVAPGFPIRLVAVSVYGRLSDAVGLYSLTVDVVRRDDFAQI